MSNAPTKFASWFDADRRASSLEIGEIMTNIAPPKRSTDHYCGPAAEKVDDFAGHLSDGNSLSRTHIDRIDRDMLSYNASPSGFDHVFDIYEITAFQSVFKYVQRLVKSSLIGK